MKNNDNEINEKQERLINQNHRSTIKIIFLVINANLGAFLLGYMLAVYNPLQESLHITRQWDKETAKFMDGLITAVFPIGCMIGSICSGRLTQNYGRYTSLILIDILGMVATLIMLIDSTPALFIGRFLIGISVGVNSTIIPIYNFEMSPESINGQMGSIFQAMIVIGILLPFFLGLGVPSGEEVAKNGGTNYWRLMYGIPFITCLIRIIILRFVFPFETPSALVQQNEHQKAEDVLNWIYHPEFVQPQLNRIKEQLQKQSKVSYHEIFFSGKYTKRISAALILAIIQQLTGFNSVIFYSNQMFSTAGGSSSELLPRIFSIIVGIVLLVGAIWGGKLVDKYGRKVIMLYSQLGIIITMVIIGWLIILNVSKILAMLLILVNAIAYGSGLGPVFWIILPELVPDAGVSSACVVIWFFTSFVGFIFPILKDSSLQLQGVFFMYSAISFIGLIYIYFMIKETKGQTQQEIMQAYEGYSLIKEDQIELTNQQSAIKRKSQI